MHTIYLGTCTLLMALAVKQLEVVLISGYSGSDNTFLPGYIYISATPLFVHYHSLLIFCNWNKVSINNLL